MSTNPVGIPSRPALYARVSLDRSGERDAVERQEALCLERAHELGWATPTVYVDNSISARSGKRRPEFERLLDDIREGRVDGLIAWHLDRLLRRVIDLEAVVAAIDARRTPIPVVFLQAGSIDLSSPGGLMLARILAAVAANEGDIKAARLRARRAQDAAAGRAHGPLGYGYDAEQHIVPEEAAVVREIAARLLDGESLYAIASSLNERGIDTPAAGKWDAKRVDKAVRRNSRPALTALILGVREPAAVSAAALARLLRAAGATHFTAAAQVKDASWWMIAASAEAKMDDATIAVMLREAGVQAETTDWRAANLRAMIRRGSLAGYREYSPEGRGGSGTIMTRGDWVPILSRDTTDKIRQLTDRVGVRKRGAEPKYLLAGVLKCGACGHGLGGMPNGAYGHRYGCAAPSKGKEPAAVWTLSAVDIEKGALAERRCGRLSVVGEPVDRLVSQAVVDALADAKVRSGSQRPGSRGISDADFAKAETELAEVERLREIYAAEAAGGGMTPDEWRVARETLTGRQRAAEKTLGAWAPNLRAALSEVPTGRPEIQKWWDEAPMHRRRAVIKLLIERIVIAPAEARSRRFDPRRVGDPTWKV